MKLKQAGSNQTLLTLGDKVVLFSYETPVALYENGVYSKTDTHYSRATTKHINAFIGSNPCKVIAQGVLNDIVK